MTEVLEIRRSGDGGAAGASRSGAAKPSAPATLRGLERRRDKARFAEHRTVSCRFAIAGSITALADHWDRIGIAQDNVIVAGQSYLSALAIIVVAQHESTWSAHSGRSSQHTMLQRVPSKPTFATASKGRFQLIRPHLEKGYKELRSGE